MNKKEAISELKRLSEYFYQKEIEETIPNGYWPISESKKLYFRGRKDSINNIITFIESI